MSAPEAMGTLLGGGSVVVVVDEASVLITLLGTEKEYGSSLEIVSLGSSAEFAFYNSAEIVFRVILFLARIHVLK